MKPSKHPEVIKARACTIDYLTRAYNYATNTRTNTVDTFTPEEWLRVFDAYLASGWDFTPDEWSRDQRDAAAWCGIVPEFTQGEKPVPLKCAGLYIDESDYRIYRCLGCERCDNRPVLTEGAFNRVLNRANENALKEGWAIFNHHEGRPQVQRDDSPDDEEVTKLTSDDAALPLAQRALSKACGMLVDVRS